MKKFLSLLLILGLFSVNLEVFAIEKISEETKVVSEKATEQTTLKVHDDAPVWAEYVAPKYRNPRSDFSKKGAISELAVGVLLTELIITAPIGIPMVVHGTTKVKMVSYNNRKKIFDEEIAKARLIQDDKERAAAYKKILKRCHLKESTREHYAKKEAKAAAKAAKKAQELEK